MGTVARIKKVGKSANSIEVARIKCKFHLPNDILANSFSLFVSVLAIIFVEIILWSGRNGSRADTIFVTEEYSKSANRSDLSIKTTKNIKFCIIITISALRNKLWIFITLTLTDIYYLLGNNTKYE
jgi:hypothetical protein